ncbi:MAG: MOSC domain-containing protein [Ignavibacteria bacterium]|nr:MOSC domain-containing protein [Ignavibacteria bacterium]MBT8383338.1 MOSC domain-containing protein [Ignavibacteria bacterium]MBT8391410.1 MOSC domain-containing protein [Ignavibacteria bacterium]NNJ52412.1 MOSC domain-containing protein [Ignavibacteriaceae bacterium]
MYKLSQINVYPIKSLAGIPLQSSFVDERGLIHDRRWMLVYENGMFFTQRDHPQMALLQPSIEKNILKVSHKHSKTDELEIPLVPDGSSEIDVTVWDDKCIAQTYSTQIDEWFSNVIGIKCRLVFMPDSFRREINNEFVQNKSVGFADAYPFLIIGKESLKKLNGHLKVPLPMNRFRTNFVFSGGSPFDEDTWKRIKIGDVVFDVIKPCARCVITTVNQSTGEKGKEPLAALSKFRRVNGKVLFGQNMVADSAGEININLQIEVLERK